MQGRRWGKVFQVEGTARANFQRGKWASVWVRDFTCFRKLPEQAFFKKQAWTVTVCIQLLTICKTCSIVTGFHGGKMYLYRQNQSIVMFVSWVSSVRSFVFLTSFLLFYYTYTCREIGIMNSSPSFSDYQRMSDMFYLCTPHPCYHPPATS